MTGKEKIIGLIEREIVPYLADVLITNGVTFATDTNVPSKLFGNSGQFKWISVEDRLPEDSGTRVLVYINSTRSYTKIDTDRFDRVNGLWVRWGMDVTHWIPLPEPPEVD